MEEETPGNGKMPGGEEGPPGDEAIRLIWERVEKLTRELDQVRRDTENRWADATSTLNRILLQQAKTMLTSTVTTSLIHSILTVHSRLSNELVEEEGTLAQLSKKTLLPKKVPLSTEYP